MCEMAAVDGRRLKSNTAYARQFGPLRNAKPIKGNRAEARGFLDHRELRSTTSTTPLPPAGRFKFFGALIGLAVLIIFLMTGR